MRMRMRKTAVLSCLAQVLSVKQVFLGEKKKGKKLEEPLRLRTRQART